jgi:RHS repeat-associated protein
VTQGSVDGSTNYQYDAASQVTAATHTSQTSESYQYDANGNRTNTGTTTGDNNRLLSDDRYDYQYDAEGNRTRRTERATGNSEVLAWDHRNRLTSVTTFSATGTKLATAEFTYDVFDRRIARKVDADGNGVFETTQRFAYDGDDLILAFSETTNVLTNRYLYGPATDEILADEKITTGTAGTVTWSLGDNLGTIRDLVQYNAATGTTTVVNHVRYDTFGQIVGQTNTAFQPYFAYTGREWDPAVGLYFYRARWYDPRAGRFTSEDPLGFAAGDVNLSRYVGNGPTLWVDPSGMESGPRIPTKNTYRQDFIDKTPAIKGTDFQIHHTLQQEEVLAKRFLEEKGINVHEQQYLRAANQEIHKILNKQQMKFWEDIAADMSREANRKITPTEAKKLIDLDIVEGHSKSLTSTYEDCLVKSGATAKDIGRAQANSKKLLNNPKDLAKRLAVTSKIDWQKLMTAAQLLMLAHLAYSAGNAIASPTPQQQQIRDDFIAEFDSAVGYAMIHHRINQEKLDQLREFMIPYMDSIGVPTQVQTAIQLKMSLIETQSN